MQALGVAWFKLVMCAIQDSSQLVLLPWSKLTTQELHTCSFESFQMHSSLRAFGGEEGKTLISH